MTVNNHSQIDSSRTHHFTQSLRQWRRFRKMSQLDLALRADVSQKHVSWLETGRSQPSREMVLRLSEAMEVPLRDRNHILNAAGYAAVYTEKQLDEPTMKPVLNVLTHVLNYHDPYPAFVLDQYWNIKMKNSAADMMLNFIKSAESLWQEIGDDGQENLALLTLHPNGLRQYISNWNQIAGPFIRRLNREAISSGDAKKITFCETLSGYVSDLTEQEMNKPMLPILPLEFDLGDLQLSLFSVIATFGTAQDITTEELRIETLYPTDDQTAKFFSE